jgi:hypothetical protein
VNVLILIYVAGIGLGLLMIDARPPVRIGLSILWPIGPLAFIVTIAILLVASLIAFPALGAAAAIVAVLAWWIYSL